MIDADIIETIRNFDPQRIGGVLHFPQIYRNGNSSKPCVGCACGAELDCDPRHAPSDQPWPRHWVGFQAFLKHLREKEADHAAA